MNKKHYLFKKGAILGREADNLCILHTNVCNKVISLPLPNIRFDDMSLYER